MDFKRTDQRCPDRKYTSYLEGLDGDAPSLTRCEPVITMSDPRSEESILSDVGTCALVCQGEPLYSV